jgi:hypothetical protein
MHQITITKVEEQDTAYAVRYGCQTYVYHTVDALLVELESYLRIEHRDDQQKRDNVFREARNYYDNKGRASEDSIAIGPADPPNLPTAPVTATPPGEVRHENTAIKQTEVKRSHKKKVR